MAVADKIGALLEAQEAEFGARFCFVSKTQHGGSCIDFVQDGRGVYGGLTLEEERVSCPDAELMTVDEFRDWKAAQQDSPVIWDETSEERFVEMRGCLPPALMCGGGFLVGEPWDHHAKSGLPRFQAFLKFGGKFFVASRPMTRDEFREAARRAI